MSEGFVDYWCNAFTPDRRPLWEESIAAQGASIRIRPEGPDDFASPDAMARRMDAQGVAALLVPVCELPVHAGVRDFETFAARPEEIEAWSKAHPGRFFGLVSIDPTQGGAGVEHARQALDAPWAVGLHTHTHSWDRRFDHADYYPYYAEADARGVPFVMQAGASGGRMPSECGHPSGIDRPALYFPKLAFVLSHTGWPWVEETVAVAQRLSNVYIGTATWPPRRYGDALLAFLRGAGRDKVLLGTGYPLTAHGPVLEQLAPLDLPPRLRDALVGGTARGIFTRLPR